MVLLSHATVSDICVRLLRGEVIEVADESGRIWRATANSFSLVFHGVACPLLESAPAYDVASLLVKSILPDRTL